MFETITRKGAWDIHGAVRAIRSAGRAGAAAALAAAFLVSPARIPDAQAHDVTSSYMVFVWVHKVDEKSCLDGCGSADFYAIFDVYGHAIDGVSSVTNHIRDDSYITPDWHYRVGKSSSHLVDQYLPVSIAIWDSDNGRGAPFDPDDHVDITPGSGRTLEMLVHLSDPLDPDIGGVLIDANTGAELGVFKQHDSVDGRPVGWRSVPRGGSISTWLSSAGTASDRAKIEYRITIHRVPDFRVSQITVTADGATRVEVINDGGPGTLTSVTCSNNNGEVRRDVALHMAARTSDVVTVPISRASTCTAAGENHYGWREPHVDNNARVA